MYTKRQLLFALTALLCSLCSCSSDGNDPRFCFECSEKKTESSPTGYYNETITVTEYCNKTDAEAERIRKDGTRNETSSGMLINYHTTCTKQ